MSFFICSRRRVNMKSSLVIVNLFLVLFLVSCQPSTPIVVPTPLGQAETQAATASMSATNTATVPTESPTPAASLFKVQVPANGCWIPSEVNVLAGQKITFYATGTVNTWGGRDGSSSGPGGQKSVCGATQCPVQGAGYGALVGRLEDQPAFLIGTNLIYTATADGKLYFSVNDWECEDNTGTFSLAIKVE